MEDFLDEEQEENPSMFTQKPSSAMRRGMGETAVTDNVSPQSGFAAKTAPPVWRMFVDNVAFQKSNAQAIASERQALSRSDAAVRESQRLAEKNDPVKLGFERELDSTQNEISRISLTRQDPNFKRLDKKEREMFEAEYGMKETSAQRKKELDAVLGREKQLDEEDQHLYGLKVKANELKIGGPGYWQQTYAQQQKDIADQGNEAASNAQGRAKALETADNSAAQEETALMQKMQQGVRGTELTETQAKLKELKQTREAFAEQKAAPDQEVEAVRGQAQQSLEGERRQREAQIRESINIKNLDRLTGVERGGLEATKDTVTVLGKAVSDLNTLDVPSEGERMKKKASVQYLEEQLNGMTARLGGRENVRADLQARIANYDKALKENPNSTWSETRLDNVMLLKMLERQDEKFAEAGITDPKDRERIVKDAALENYWTAQDTDNVRGLSTGEVVFNPARIFGQRDRIEADIKAKAGSEADAAEAIARMEAVRVNVVAKIAEDLRKSDGSFKTHESAMKKAGVTDEVKIVDSYAATMRDRNEIIKFGDAVITGVKEGGAGIYKTAVGGTAGAVRLVGADELAGSMGAHAQEVGKYIAASDSAFDTRGNTGYLSVSKDLSGTVTQMAPMFVGGAYAKGLKGITQAIVAGTSVYGWAGAQGYESKLSDAIEIEKEKFGGRDLTEKEIASTLGRADVQLSAFANAAQTMILAKVLGGGVERAALGKAAQSMSLRDFLTKGGRRALQDSTLRAELKKMGKTIFADAKDEFVEEGLNQFLDKAISAVGLGQDFKLGDVLEESIHAGLMGAVVGGGLPQLRRGEQASAEHDERKGVNTRLIAQDPGSPKAQQDEIDKAKAIAEKPSDLDDVAKHVAITREINAKEEAGKQSFIEAQEKYTQAQATGDPVAIAQAEQVLGKATAEAAAPTQTKGMLKITNGKGLETLTDAEVKSLGITREGKPVSAKELAAAGLTAPLVSNNTADGSLVITDAGSAIMGSVSPAAKTQVTMDETQYRAAAIAKAQAAAAGTAPGAAAGTTGSTGSTGTAPGSRTAPEEAPFSPKGIIKRTNAELDQKETELKAILRQNVTDPDGQEVAKLAQLSIDAIRAEKDRRAADPNFVDPAAATPGIAPTDRVFRITGTNGTVIEVTARNEADAQNQAVSDPSWQGGEKVDSVLDVTPETAEINLGAEVQPGANAPTNTGAPTSTDRPEVRIKKALAKAKKMLGDGLKITNDPNKKTAAHEDGTIVINIDQLKAAAAKRNMSEEETSVWISKSIDEEVRHAAQHRAAQAIWKSKGSPGDYVTWRNEHYGKIWQNEFVASGKDQMVIDIYGAKLARYEPWEKAFEGLRIIQQKTATGSPTEIAKFWANLRQETVDHLRAALKALKELVASGLSPELQVEIDAITAQLKEYDKANKPAKAAPAPKSAPQADASRWTFKEIADDLYNLGAGEISSLSDFSPKGPRGTTTNEMPSRQDLEGLFGKPFTEEEWIDLQNDYVGGRNFAESQAAEESAPTEPQEPKQPTQVTFVRNGETITGTFRIQSEKNGKIIVEVNGKNVLVDPSEIVEQPKPVSAKPQETSSKSPETPEWENFPEEFQSLGIPRAEMPQIKAEDRSAMVQFLKARGINYEADVMMRPSQLSPTQAEYSREKVEKAKSYEGGNRAILVSANGRVIDGHHQWLAALETDPDTPIKVIILEAPVMEILETVKQMPSVETAEGASAPAPAPAPAPIADFSQAEYAKRKRALNKAIKAKDWPTVVAKATADLEYFEKTVFPDDWSMWERAKEDAEQQISPRNYVEPILKPYVPASEAAPQAKPAPAPAAKPALSEGESALKNMFTDLVDGLETAELTDEFYQQPIPVAKMGQLIGAAQILISEGVTTPEGLAASLDRISPKLRVYSKAVWGGFVMANPSLQSDVKWLDVYAEIDAAKLDNQQQLEDSNSDETNQSNLGSEDQETGEQLEPGSKGSVDSKPGSDLDSPGDQKRSPNNGKASGGGKNTGSVGGRSPRPGNRSDSSASGPGEGSGSGPESSNAGTGASNTGNGTGVAGNQQPAYSGRPGYRLTDPEKIIGAKGPKDRFARNQKALETFDRVFSEGREPTPEELDAMAAYIGWGSFGQELFQGSWDRPNPKDEWTKESEWLREHLGQAGWESIRDSIINAHYTDPPHVKALWDIVQHLGFKGGRTLEPSMGIGNFFGLMPDVLRSKSSLTGIELDSVVGGMAKMLYPDANIRIMGYEKSATADNFYDLIIGNWPFHKEGPSDTRYNHLKLSLHDYFFVKALDQVRPGGLVVGITSSGTMDKKGQVARRQMAKRAKLVGAFRFPSGAFKGYAGTSVVTDVIILQKRTEQLSEAGNEEWIESERIGEKDKQFNANVYWRDNPTHILGEMKYGHGTTFGRAGMTVERPDNYETLLGSITDKLPAGIYTEGQQRPDRKEFFNRENGEPQNSVVYEDGSTANPKGFYIVRGEQLQPLSEVFKWEVKSEAETKKRSDQLSALLDLRKQVKELLTSQREDYPDTNSRRSEALATFNAFVKKHGSIKDSTMIKAFEKANDPMALTLLNLERKENGKTVPRDILLKDIMRRAVVDVRGNIQDAYAIQRNESISLDIARIAEISESTEQEVVDRLLDLNQIYKTPAGTWETGEEYLGGNVRRKLREAIDAKEQGFDMDRNIAALENIQPADVAYFEIEVQMGASWISKEDYLGYVSHLLGADPEMAEKNFTLTKASSGWNFKVNNDGLGRGTNAKEKYGVAQLPFAKIFQAAMNNTQVKVWNPKDDDGRVTLNDEATKIANGKVDTIREELAEWLWADPARTGRLSNDYNEVMNSEVTPKRNGDHLRLEGLALKMGNSEFDFRKHQKDAVWRFIMDGKGVGAHEVGTGKTFTMAGLAVEGRRLGKFRKTLIFAHNANSQAVYEEFQMAYPNGKFLYVDNLSPENRDSALRQIALDEWDAVIVPHSLIERFTLSEKTLMQIADKQIVALENEIAQELEDIGYNQELDLDDMKSVGMALKYVKDSSTAKELVKQRIAIRKRIADKAAKAQAEGAILFEDLGIDNIIVDEAHIFKKINLATRKVIKGLNKVESGIGWQMGAITDYVKGQNGGKGVYLFTGTPLTNNLNEAYNMMRFVMDEEMSDSGIDNFDDWFNSFAAAVSDVELTTGGTHEPVTRLLSFVNVPELARMAGRYFDVVLAKDMPEFKDRESTEGMTENPVGRPFKAVKTVISDMSPEQLAHKEQIRQQYVEYQAMDGKGKMLAMKMGRPTPITMEGQGTASALDYRLVDPTAPDYAGSKINMMLGNAMTHYNEHPESTQMIFMERGLNDYTDNDEIIRDEFGMPTYDDEGKARRRKVRRPKFNLARDIVEKLMAQGVAPEEIAILGNMSLDPIALRPNDPLRKVLKISAKLTKADIASLANQGKVRFMIGGTETMGTGVNAQRNLRAMHHLDAPWTPGALEQRNGRGWRQGNRWNTVNEYRYFAEGSHDGRRWQVLLNKVRFIYRFTQMLLNTEGQNNLRVLAGDGADMNEGGSSVADFEQSFSAAAGDPRLLLRAKLAADVNKLERKRDTHFRSIEKARESIRDLKKDEKYEKDQLEFFEKVIDVIKGTFTKDFEFQFLGKTYTERKKAEEAIANQPIPTSKDDGKILGKYGDNITLRLKWDSGSNQPIQWRIEIALPNGARHEMTLGAQSLGSLEGSMRGLMRNVSNRQERFGDFAKSIASLEEMLGKEFTRQPELDSKKKALLQILTELSQSPFPAPSWLRNGAPAGSLVYVDGEARDVEAHRWDKTGYWILLESENGGLVPVDYRKVMDEAGNRLFEDHPFEAPPDSKELTEEEIRGVLGGEFFLASPDDTSASGDGWFISGLFRDVGKWRIYNSDGDILGEGESAGEAYKAYLAETTETKPEEKEVEESQYDLAGFIQDARQGSKGSPQRIKLRRQLEGLEKALTRFDEQFEGQLLTPRQEMIKDQIREAEEELEELKRRPGLDYKEYDKLHAVQSKKLEGLDKKLRSGSGRENLVNKIKEVRKKLTDMEEEAMSQTQSTLIPYGFTKREDGGLETADLYDLPIEANPVELAKHLGKIYFTVLISDPETYVLRPNYFETKKDAEEARANDQIVIEQRREEAFQMIKAINEELFGKRLENADLSDEMPEFYSQLSRTITEKMPKTATPMQVLQIAKAGAKADEIKWSGLIPWLQGKEKVSKDDVLNWLATEGSVKFKEVTMGRSENQARIAELTAQIEARGYELQEEYGEYIIFNVEEDEDITYDDLPEDLQPLFDEIQELTGDEQELGVNDATKYAQHQLPGGENYREVVLAMPGGSQKSQKQLLEDAGFTFEQYGNNWYVQDPEGGVVSEGATLERAIEMTEYAPIEQGSIDYRSTHFPDVPNYVAHMRLNERSLPGKGYTVRNTKSGRTGPVFATLGEAEADMKQYPATYSLEIKEVNRDEKGLFIEEIQSDRHQAGRKKGYKGDFPENVLKAAIAGGMTEAAARADIDHLLEEPLSTAARPTGDQWKRLSDAVGSDVDLNEVFHDKREEGIADAPFRTSWPLQMFKRALRDAVRSGKDWIGWTTGETQNDRYNLSNHIKSIDWVTSKNSINRDVFIEPIGQNGFTFFVKPDGTVINNSGESAAGIVPDGSRLDEVIGKDVADLILSRESGELSGEGLNIGGKGMKGFYDTMLPKEIGKYVKQWGAKVEKAKLSEASEGMYILDAEDIGADVDSKQEVIIRHRVTLEGIADFESIRAAEDWLEKNDPTVRDFWKITITPELRKAVGAGQALYNAPLEDDLGEMGTLEEREEIRKQQAAFKEEGKVVGRPDLANPGMSEETRDLFDEEDEIRKLYANRETWAQWNKAGEKLANEDEDKVVRTWLAAALQADKAADAGGVEFDAQQLNPELVVAIRIIMERRAKQAGGDPAKLAKVAILRNAYRSARANIARVMAAGVDTLKKPEQRHREQLVNLITTLPEKDMRNIEERFGSGTKEQQAAKEQEIEKQTVDQIKRIEKELAKMGVTIDEVLNGEAFLSLSQNRIIRNITDKMDNASRLAVKLMQQGNGFDAIRRKTGLPDAKIEKIRADLYKKLEEKIRAKVEAGMTLEDMKDQMKGALESAALSGLTPEQVQAEIDRIISVGFGIPQSLQKKSGIPTAKKVPKKIEDDEDSLEAGANRIAQRWIDRLAISQSDTLAWKTAGKEDELNKLIRAHLAKPVPNFARIAQSLGATAEQARILDAEAATERGRKAAIREWKKQNPTKRKPKTLEPKKAYEVDWNRPEFSEGLEDYAFTTTERTDLMERVVELRLLTGITGTVESLTGKDRVKGDKLIEEMNVILAKYKTDALEMAQGKMKAANYRFDINDRRHVAIIARTIAAINASAIEKVQEYYYSSILSGLQTMIVNATGIVNSTYQAVVDRGFETMLNSVIGNKDNASLGEYQYLMKALRPGWARAWSNAISTWNTEIPFFEEDILNRPPDFQRIAEAGSSYRPGSIAGVKGRIIRTPSRILMATDDFLNTLRASAEVGAMAFRMAKKKGMTPGTEEFARFLQLEVNTPGSISWQMAADRALKGSFNAPLPGQPSTVQQSKKKSENVVPVRTAMDFVGFSLGKIQKALTPVELENSTTATLKTLTRMLFIPFIRVPFNIMQQGIERTVNPLSILDMSILIGSNLRVKNGKFTLNADGGKERLIEYASKQMQGVVLLAVLAALGEGDDDDLEKTILITGSRPYKDTKKGERELGYRMGLGPYTISIKMPGGKRLSVSYGRIEPFATMMGGTVDTLKAVKLRTSGKIGTGEMVGKALSGLTSQINEKTSLRGAADMLEILSGEGAIDKFAADRLSVIMPNFVKQALRESDPLFRERPTEFKDMLIAATFPSGEITGLPAKVNLYGQDQEKPGKTALGRIFDPTDTTVYGASEKTDKMLYNWIRQNPNADLVAPSSAGKTYTDPITKEKSVTMSADQYSKFVKVAGDRIKSQVKRTPFNIDNPTEMDIKRFREIVSDSREIAKRVLVMQEAWRNLK